MAGTVTRCQRTATARSPLVVEESCLARAKAYSGPGPVALGLSGDDLDEQHVAEAMGLKGAGAVNSL